MSLAHARLSRGAALAAAGRVAEEREALTALRAALLAKYGPGARVRRLAAQELAKLGGCPTAPASVQAGLLDPMASTALR